jgi:hypothetical protein
MSYKITAVISFVVVVLLLAGIIVMWIGVAPTAGQAITPQSVAAQADCTDDQLLQVYNARGEVYIQWPCCSVGFEEHPDGQTTATVYRCGVGPVGKIVFDAGKSAYMHDMRK